MTPETKRRVAIRISPIVVSTTPVVGTGVLVTVNVLVAVRVEPSGACSVNVTDCAPSVRSSDGVKLKMPELSDVTTPVWVAAPVMVIVTVAPALAVPVSVGRLLVTVERDAGTVSCNKEISVPPVPGVGKGEGEELKKGDGLTDSNGTGVRVGVAVFTDAAWVGDGVVPEVVVLTVTVTGVDPVNTFFPPSLIAPTKVASVSRTVAAPAAFALNIAVATVPAPDFGVEPVGKKTVRFNRPFALSIDFPVVLGEEKNVPGTKSTASTFVGSNVIYISAMMT